MGVTTVNVTGIVSEMATIAHEVWGASAACITFPVMNGGIGFGAVLFSRGFGWETSTPVVHYPAGADQAAREAADAWAAGEAVDASNELSDLAVDLLALVAEDVAAHRTREADLTAAATAAGTARTEGAYRSQIFISGDHPPYLVEVAASGALSVEF